MGISFITDLFKKAKFSTVKPEPEEKVNKEVPDGLFFKCPTCHNVIYMEKIKARNYVCPECKHYLRLNAYQRIDITVDEGTFVELWNNLKTVDPLKFKGYQQKIGVLEETLDVNEAVIVGTGEIDSQKVCIGAMDSRFMMASMGSVVGEKLTRLFEFATENSLPVILFTCSGGARMQEGIFSLMQMAKVSGALARHSEAGLLYITVLTDPTTGGVTASFAMDGDIILAEPRANVGFAGRRVIEGTIGEKLPSDFQSSEFICQHGFCDRVVKRKDMKKVLSKILEIHTPNLVKEVSSNDSEEN